MLTLVYFARFREVLGVDQEQLALPEHVTTVAQLIDHLLGEREGRWAEVLQAANLLIAVNQDMVDAGHMIKDGDEIAFFPPVTGG